MPEKSDPASFEIEDVSSLLKELVKEGREIVTDTKRILDDREKETSWIETKLPKKRAERGNARPKTPGEAGEDTGGSPMSNFEDKSVTVKVQPFDEIAEMKETKSVWISLFHEVKEEARYSFTTDISVNAPLFYYQKKQPWTEQGTLPVLIRPFSTPLGLNLEVAILPAKIEKKKGKFKGEWIDYYPGDKEEVLLEVLKKMAMDGKGIVLDQMLAVAFYVRDIQRELKRIGKSASSVEIMQSLFILRRSSMVCKNRETGGVIFEETYILSLGESGKGRNKRVVVRFNSPTTESIKNATHRIVDYETSMRLKTLGRKLLHKITYSKRNLDKNNPYTFFLSEYMEEVGYGFSTSRPRESAELMDSVLEEITSKTKEEKEQKLLDLNKRLQVAEAVTNPTKKQREYKISLERQIESLNKPLISEFYKKISKYTKDAVVKEGTRTVIDYEYTLWPTRNLIGDVVKANARQRARQEALNKSKSND
ncbi:MAG: hypothetical protein JEY71_10420 [Sphaerochaeta sp.]|nr:hypothetical protein [Sphaerochaeta sp.]